MDEWHTHRKFWTLFPFDRILKHNFYFYFNPVNNKEKIKLSGNVAFPTMLQSVVFGGSLKIEDWKLQSNFNFCLSAKTFKIVDRTTQEGGGGVHSHGNFLSLVLSPQISFPPCEIFTPPPPHSPTLYFSGEEEAGNSYLSRSHFSKHKRLQCWVHKGSCNNSKKNTLRGELITKRKISRQERL